MNEFLCKTLNDKPRMTEASLAGPSSVIKDSIITNSSRHPTNIRGEVTVTAQILTTDPTRRMGLDNPRIHYGILVSGNTPIKECC